MPYIDSPDILVELADAVNKQRDLRVRAYRLTELCAPLRRYLTMLAINTNNRWAQAAVKMTQDMLRDIQIQIEVCDEAADALDTLIYDLESEDWERNDSHATWCKLNGHSGSEY